MKYLSPSAQSFTLVIAGTLALLCLMLGLTQIASVSLNPAPGLLAVAGLIVLILCILSRLTLPFYIIVAGPSIALSLSDSGILSRLYIGDLLFVLLAGIWLLHELASKDRAPLAKRETLLLVPLICLVFIGFVSIVASHLSPDPHVTYAFAHSTVSLVVVNGVEMFLLSSLPLFILIVPGIVRTLKDARRALGAYLVVGLPYALGTIFAGPLHLYSQATILGIQRPAVFGADSSNLGMLNVLFTCLALGQLLYAKRGLTRLGLLLLAGIYALGVVMSFGRESWLGLILATWVISWFRFKSPFVFLAPLLLVPLAILLFPGIIDFFDPTKVYGADRINIWQDAIVIWQHSPYLGVGAGNFQFFDLSYGIEVVGVAHNQLLEVLAEMGVQGLACLLVTIVMTGYIALKRFKAALSRAGKAIALAYLGYFAALLLATFFTDSFIQSTSAAGGTGPFIEMSYCWIFLGLVLSIPNWDGEAATSELSGEISSPAVLSTQHQKGLTR